MGVGDVLMGYKRRQKHAQNSSDHRAVNNCRSCFVNTVKAPQKWDSPWRPFLLISTMAKAAERNNLLEFLDFSAYNNLYLYIEISVLKSC